MPCTASQYYYSKPIFQIRRISRPDEKLRDEDDKLTKEKLLCYIYEYGLYALLGIAIGLVANMVIRAVI